MLVTSGHQDGWPGTGAPRLTISHEERPSTIMKPANPTACPRGEWSETVAAMYPPITA